MIDASTDQDYAASERAAAHAEARRETRRERPARGTLADLAARSPGAARAGVLQADVAGAAAEASAAAGTAEPPREPDDALASLRVARLGFAAAVVLAVLAIWASKRSRR